MEKLDIKIVIVIVILSLFIGWYSTTGVKSQWVRALDILIYGPVLIYAGLSVQQIWLGVILLIFGATTITYNLRNFISTNS